MSEPNPPLTYRQFIDFLGERGLNDDAEIYFGGLDFGNGILEELPVTGATIEVDSSGYQRILFRHE